MNPVRTFAPAYWNQSFPIHWVNERLTLMFLIFEINEMFHLQVYWVAPMLSGIITAIGYQAFFIEKPESDPELVEPLHRNELPKV